MTARAFSPEAPGLTVAVIYLRPAHRARALAIMLELGMFVRELEAVSAVSCSVEDPAEIVMLFADGQLSHRQLVRSFVLEGRIVIVVFPDGVWALPLENPDAFAFLTDASESRDLREVLTRAGQVARRRRIVEPRQSLGTTVFGGLVFRPAEPWLASEANLTALSPTEHGILRALVKARGAVVSKESLQRQLSSTLEPASDGYLKTVILRLRRKVQLLGGDPDQLSAVRGAGYVLRS